jgi:myo-inositol 2-dehydrogenase / D-chiro-inositol 1-dehydrogenase
MTAGSTSMKLGLIGCGWVTETLHLPALREVGTADIIAVADGDPDRLRRVADRFQVQRRHTDYLTLLDDSAIEAVGVTLPADRQVEVAQAVLAAGKHLFIDKPLVFDLKVWDKLIEQAAQANRKIMVVGLPRRWHRLMRRAREVIRLGTLGKIELIRTMLAGKNPERRSFQEGDRHAVKGILYQFGMHHFDVLHALLQSDVQEIFAESSSDESTVVVTGRLFDGVMVSSTFSERESRNDEVEIYGQAGHLRVSCYRFDGFEYFPAAVHPGDVKTRVQRAVHSLKELPQGLLRMRQGGDFIDSYRVGWQHCVDAIRQDTRPDCTLVEARSALQLVIAAKESVEVGRPVKVSQLSHDRI